MVFVNLKWGRAANMRADGSQCMNPEALTCMMQSIGQSNKGNYAQANKIFMLKRCMQKSIRLMTWLAGVSAYDLLHRACNGVCDSIWQDTSSGLWNSGRDRLMCIAMGSRDLLPISKAGLCFTSAQAARSCHYLVVRKHATEVSHCWIFCTCQARQVMGHRRQ